MKKIILVLLLLPLLFSFNNVSANEPNFKIKSYNMDIEVTKENVFKITEKIDVSFFGKGQGIYRYIPINSEVRYKDKVYKTKVHIENVSVPHHHFEDSYEDGYKMIIIGSKGTFISGDHSYTIKYDYRLGKDIFKNEDLFYYNLITGWKTTIDLFTFNITFPDNVLETPYFSEDIKYQVNDNVISGEMKNILPNKNLTSIIHFEEGYFSDAKDYAPIETIVLIICLIISIVIFLLWAIFGKDRMVIDVVGFYPPENLSVARLSYCYKGDISSQRDYPMLVFNLASEKYVKIEQEDKDIRVTKLKEYDGEREEEKIFFDRLFKEEDSVLLSSLKDDFYRTIAKIHECFRKTNKKIYEKLSNKLAIFSTFLTMGSIIGLVLLGMENYFYFIVPVILSIIVDVVFTILMPKRTKYGAKILGEINGFKNYIKLAKEDELKQRLLENDKYFYDILPYAYVFGIQDSFVKRFEGLANDGYYYKDDMFVNYVCMYAIFNDVSRSISVPKSTGDGSVGSGFGGGGFGGGGFGGGGGGSW